MIAVLDGTALSVVTDGTPTQVGTVNGVVTAITTATVGHTPGVAWIENDSTLRWEPVAGTTPGVTAPLDGASVVLAGNLLVRTPNPAALSSDGWQPLGMSGDIIGSGSVTVWWTDGTLVHAHNLDTGVDELVAVTPPTSGDTPDRILAFDGTTLAAIWEDNLVLSTVDGRPIATTKWDGTDIVWGTPLLDARVGDTVIWLGDTPTIRQLPGDLDPIPGGCYIQADMTQGWVTHTPTRSIITTSKPVACDKNQVITDGYAAYPW
jgi:hypothetical protein